MKRTLPIPPVPENPTPADAASDFLNRPEFDVLTHNLKKRCVTWLLMLIFVLVLLVGAGFGGYRYYLARHTAKTTMNSSVGAADAYAGWKTYRSSTEKVTFMYPSDWTVSTQGYAYTDAADVASFTSPSKKVIVGWVSQITGLGGACDRTIKPGSDAAKASTLGTCPYFKVTDKQKLIGANLYYVAGTKTIDGVHYLPWMAIQDDGGILSSEGDPGYLVFQGKFNTIIQDGQYYGVADVELTGAVGNLPPFSDGGQLTGSTSESVAENFFSTTEAQQAKLILLSLKYVADPTTTWMTYASPENHYSLRIPDGWQLTQNCSGPYAPLLFYGGAGSLEVNQGQIATVTDQCFGRDATPELSIQWYNLADATGDAQEVLDGVLAANGLQQQVSFTTDSGLTINKYSMSVTQPRQNLDQYEQGNYYFYVIKNSKGYVLVSNFYAPGAVDYHQNLEEALKTLRLN